MCIRDSTQGNSVIYDNGTNVGIGTTAPQTTLQILNPGSSTIGTTQIGTGYPSLDLVGVQISGVGYADISANAYHNGSSWAKRNSSYESWIVNQSVNTSNTGDWAIYHTNAGATPPGNRLFTITSSGNVGIGTSAPTQRLQVNGVIGLIPMLTVG